jgi:hypothetical protein
MSEPLARTTVEIDADLQKLNAKLSEVEQKLNNTGKAGVDTGKKLEGGFQRAFQSAEKLRSVVTKLFIPAAIVATVFRLVRAFEELRTKAEKTRKAMRDVFSNAEKEAMQLRRRGLTDLQKELADLNDQAKEAEQAMIDVFLGARSPDSLTGIFKTIFGDSKDLDEALAKMRAVFDELKRQRMQMNQERQAEFNQQMSTEISLVDAQQNELLARRLENEKKFEQAANERHIAEMARYHAELEQLQKLQEEYRRTFGEDSDFIQARIEAEYELHQLRVGFLLDEAKQSAAAYRKEMEDAIRSIQETIRSSFGFNFTSFGQLTTVLNKVATEIQRRRP